MQTSQGSPRPLLTALEVQELLHIDRSTVYRMAEDGRLPAIRVGRSWRFPTDRIEALLDAGDTADQAPEPVTDATGPAPAPAGGAPVVPASGPAITPVAAHHATSVDTAVA